MSNEIQVAPQGPSPSLPVPTTGAASQGFALLGFNPQSMKEAMEIATVIANSDFVPKDYKGKPGNVLIAWEMAKTLGISPLQLMPNYSVINGRGSIWGELATALVRGAAFCESLTFSDPAEVAKTGVAWTKLKRRGQDEEIVGRFTVEDAKKAGLWGKQGPWTQYPNWMLQMRANCNCYKLGASDALKGLAIKEEVQDFEPVEGEKDLEIARPRRKSAPVNLASATEATPPPGNPNIPPPQDLEQENGPQVAEGLPPEKVTKKEIEGVNYWFVYVGGKKLYYTPDQPLAKKVHDLAQTTPPTPAAFVFDSRQVKDNCALLVEVNGIVPA